jgi:2-iminobutanoate/2-iminopropanoate deaminase
MRLEAALLVSLLACGPAGAPPSSESPALEYAAMPGGHNLPFSALVRAGSTLYLSGQLGTDSMGHLVPGGIGPETAQALENVRTLLEAHGSSMDRVVKCTVMLADIGEWTAMNREYVRQFGVRRPARSAFGTAGLALGARVEIECLAVGGPR